MSTPLPSNPADRRRSKRVPSANKMLVRRLQHAETGARMMQWRENEGNEWVEGSMIDLSMTGVGIKCTAKYEIGSILHVRILYNDPGKSYDVYGRVVWVKEGSIGLRFVKVDPGNIDLGR